MVSPTDTNELDQQNVEDSSTSAPDNEEKESSVPKESDSSDEESSTFDAIKEALKDDTEEDEDDDSKDDESDDPEVDSESNEEDSADSEDGESDEPSEDELKAWKPKTRKRFQNLQDKYRKEKSLREEAETDAGHYKQFVSFLDENRISQNEANELFNLGALMKNDPQKALELITPHYQNLLEVTGNVLPNDLEQQVDQGLITKEHALELSRHRMSDQTRKTIEQDKQQYQQGQAVRQQSETVNSIQGALASWESNWSKSDPDYISKKDSVLERVELKLARASRDGSLPKSVEEAVKMAEEAKTEVEASFRQQKPRKQVKSVEGGSSVQNLPDAKDTADVIRRTLNR